MANKKVLITGAAGYIAHQILPTCREHYDVVLVDVTQKNRQGEEIQDIVVLDLIDPDRSKYARYFEGVDAVVHLGYKRRRGANPLDHFDDEKHNVEMAYNVFRTAYDAGVERVVVVMEHTARKKDGGEDMKILPKCTLPLTGVGVVDLIITDLGVLEVGRHGLRIAELAPGVTREHLAAKTAAPVH